jgi:hypothetical protein
VSGAPDTLIGSAQASGRNVISGNRVEGIAVTGEASAGTQILGNLIGTDASGTATLGNTLHGISVRFGAVVTIGGAAAGAGNVVGGNSGGISIETSGNTILGNRIGVGESGETLGNGGAGISLSLASNNRIGGTESGEANVIAYNLGDGISVSGGSGNGLVMNAIFSNGDNLGEDLGIDLDGDGVTPNDPGDTDEGANDLQNFPELTSASVSGDSVNVQGSLDTAEAGAPFRVDYYVSDACDPSGHGQGQTWFAAQNIFTDDGGAAILDLNASGVPVAAGQFVTAVATSPGGNSSEFSACVAVEIDSIPADVTVAPVGAPQMFIAGQDFNGERTVDVTVTSEIALRVTSMRLNDLDLTSGAVVTARIYDEIGNLIAFAATVLSSGNDQQVEIPISATLVSGARYRVGFHVNPDITDGATALMFDPRETTGFPYQAEPLGRLQVESAQFNGEPHFAVPLMRVQ